MRVPHDSGHAAKPAGADAREPLRHVLVPFVEEDPGDSRVRPTKLPEDLLRGLGVVIQLPLHHLGRNEQADDAPEQQADPLPDGERTEQAGQRLAQGIVDKEHRDASLPGHVGGDAHLGPGAPVAELRPEPALYHAPEASEERSATAGGGFRPGGSEDRGRTFIVELERHRVERMGVQGGPKGELEVDHVSGPDDDHGALESTRVHVRIVR